jgi:hypothetical protein
MDANQRSEVNNQTNNGANEKWTPGAKGNTKPDAPLDHTYPQGASPRQGVMPGSEMGTPQTGAGPEAFEGTDASRSSATPDLQGGSMQTQQTGGSGPQQGITDSHQRAMEQRSQAYGKLEQPVGGRPKDSGVSLHGERQSGNTQATVDMNPQNAAQPELQGGSLGGNHGNRQSTQGGGQHGPSSQVSRQQGGSMGQQSAAPQGTQGGGQFGPQSDMSSMQRNGSMAQQSSAQPGGSMGSMQSTDRKGSETDPRNQQYDTGALESNDLTGGLPRSPGNSGPRPDERSTHQTGPDNRADLQRTDRGVHESNDVAGGYPRSPGGANKLAADEKMDDDTGFSNPRRR